MGFWVRKITGVAGLILLAIKFREIWQEDELVTVMLGNGLLFMLFLDGFSEDQYNENELSQFNRIVHKTSYLFAGIAGFCLIQLSV